MPQGVAPCVAVACRHIQHPRQAVRIEETVVALTSLQKQGKGCQLTGTRIEVDTHQIVRKNGLDGLLAAVEFVQIHGIEQVESLKQNVTRTTGRVNHAQVLQPFVTIDGLLGAFRLCYQVGHLLLKGRTRIVVQIDTA